MNEHFTDDNQRRAAIHARMKTDPKLLNQLIQQTTGQIATSQKRIIAGDSNEVYDSTLADDSHIIARISHGRTDGNFGRESWALEACHQAGIPVPLVIAQGELQQNGRPLQYMIQQKLPGKTFHELIYEDHIPEADIRDLALAAGTVLGRIHSIPTKGFGKLDDNGWGQFASIQEWFATIELMAPTLREVVRANHLDEHVLDNALERIQMLDSPLFQQQPYLIHCDYAPKHILVDKGQITGIIDFEFASSGYFGIEVPEWELRDAVTVPPAWVLEGYQTVKSLPAGQKAGQNICTLFEYLELLEYYGHQSISPHMIDVCFTAISRLSR